MAHPQFDAILFDAGGIFLLPDPTVMGAFSGMEMACWDILGKKHQRPVYALLGHPIAHSPSPLLHNTMFALTGRPGVYVALDVVVSGPELAQALRALPIAGLNLPPNFGSSAAASSIIGSREGVVYCMCQ